MAKRKGMEGSVPKLKRSTRLDLGLGSASLTLDQLDTLIAETLLEVERLQAQVASLRRIKKAKLGGTASGMAPRERRFTDEMIRRAYEAGRGHGYGGVRDAAAALGCTEQTVQRWLARSLKAPDTTPEET